MRNVLSPVTVNAFSMQPQDAARHARLVQAAQQFEAVMLSELMKPLSGGAAIGEEENGSSSNPMQSYGVEAMAAALAKSGAMGFATRMVSSVEAHAAKNIPAGTQVLLENADVSEREDQP